MNSQIEEQREIKIYKELRELASSFLLDRENFPGRYKKINVLELPPIIEFFKEYIYFRYLIYSAIIEVENRPYVEALKESVLSLAGTKYKDYSKIVADYIETHYRELEHKYMQWSKKEDFARLTDNFFTSDFNNFFDILLEYVHNFVSEEKRDRFFGDLVYFNDYYKTIPQVLREIPDNQQIRDFVQPLKNFALYMIRGLGITEASKPKTIHEFIFRYYCKYSIESEELAGYDDMLISDTGKEVEELERDFQNAEYLLLLNPLEKSKEILFFGIPLKIEKMSNQNENWFKYSVARLKEER